MIEDCLLLPLLRPDVYESVTKVCVCDLRVHVSEFQAYSAVLFALLLSRHG
jgi:hypothetical protein